MGRPTSTTASCAACRSTSSTRCGSARRMSTPATGWPAAASACRPPSPASSPTPRGRHSRSRMTFYDDLVSGGREHAEAARPGASAAATAPSSRSTIPAKLNVLSAPLVQQLKAALEELVADRAIRSIVLTGADPGFSAGGDLRMMDERARGAGLAGGRDRHLALDPLRVRRDRAADRAQRHGVHRRHQRPGRRRRARLGVDLRPGDRLRAGAHRPRLRAPRAAARGGHLVGAHPAARLPGRVRLLRRRRAPRRAARAGARARARSRRARASCSRRRTPGARGSPRCPRTRWR